MPIFLRASARFRLGWRRLILLIVCFGCAFAHAVDPAVEPAAENTTTEFKTITDLKELGEIQGPERDQPHPVRLILDVDLSDPTWKLVVGRNEGMTYAFNGDTPAPVQADQRYLLEGMIKPSERRTLAHLRLTKLPSTPPLPTIDLVGKPFNLNEYEGQRPRVRIEGYVDYQYVLDPTHMCLVILHDRFFFHCAIAATKDDFPDLRNKLIRFEGLLTVRKKQGNRTPKLDIYGQNSPHYLVLGDIQDAPLFKVKRTPIEQLPKFLDTKLVKITGTLCPSELGTYALLRDDTGLVKVLTSQVQNRRLGERIDAIGTPRRIDGEITLCDGLIRSSDLSSVPGETTSTTLRIADLVLNLPPKAAAQGQPVKITGVVTWSDPVSNYLYVQDASVGIRVQLGPGIQASDYRFLRFIEIDGITTMGKFTPEIIATKIKILDWSRTPTTRSVTYQQVLGGAEAGQWVEMQGYIRDVTHTEKETLLTIATSAGEFVTRMPLFKHLTSIVGAHIVLRGVCEVEANDRGEFKRFSMLVSADEFLLFREAAPPDPFDATERDLQSLRKFNPLQSLIRRIRVTGQVVHQVPGRYLYVQDRTSGLLALTRGTEPLNPGDHVELVGIFGREGNRPILRDTIFRRTGKNDPIAPTLLTPAEVTAEYLDGGLVQTTGQLLESNRRGEGVHLLIQAAYGSFEAILEKETQKTFPVGVKLRLTGVYQIEYDEYRQPRGFHLLLRSPDDLVVLAAPNWWTAGRALSAAGLLFAGILLVMGWVTILRRRVRQQTAQIRDQLRKEALLQVRYRAIIDNASDFIFTLDDQGLISSFNPAGERLTGLAQARALGQPFSALLSPEAAQDTLPFLALQSENEPALTCQTRLKTADNRVTWIEICARAYRESEQHCGILAVARDISDRKHIEEELRRARDAAEANTRAKSAFLANMSHEIRTPMNGVIGMTNLLLDTPLATEQRDFAETIRNSAESLLTVLNDILDFSKIEAGKLQIEAIDFDLHETVETTLELLAARASEKRLELASYLQPAIPDWVRGDPGRLRQVLLNLIGNALKFTEKGEVIINASLESETDHDLQLRVEVSDTGLGLDEETQARLFQPFSQADGSTTRKFGGTGLGLAISKQIVHLMGGQIGVRSTLGHGATFWFTVRLEKQPAGTKHEAAPKIASLKGLRTLIVDDNSTNRKILEHYCAAWGLHSESVTNAADALAALRTAADQGTPFHSVLTDYQMPEMDGLTLSREILGDKKISSSRVVLLTSWDRRFSREELSACGIVRMLVKPLRQQDVLGALLRCVRNGTGARDGSSSMPLGTLPISEESSTPQALPRNVSLRVLVAEDNIVNQRVANIQLKNLGHSVDIAANGLEVLSALETKTYDVIFMDGQMPELDGYETTRRIRQNPAYANLSIIAMTANAMQGDRERCLAVGMDDYVSKPTRPADLQAALDRCKIARRA